MLKQLNRRCHSFALLTLFSLFMGPMGCAVKSGTAVAGKDKNQSKVAALVEIIVLAVGSVFVTGCGKDSGAGATVSGVGKMGDIVNATVTVTDLNGTVKATATTDATGAWSAAISDTSAPLVVTISGKADGTSYYVDEATTTKVTLAATDTLSTIVADPSDATQAKAAVLSPYSNESYQLAKQTLGTDFATMKPSDMGKYKTNSDKQIAELHGIPVAAMTTVPVPDTSGTPNAANLAMAQYSQFLKTNGINVATDGFGAVNAIATAVGKSGQLKTADLPAAYQFLGPVFTDSSKGFGAAATQMAANPNIPAGMVTVYNADYKGQVSAPTLTPGTYIAAAFDAAKVVAAGGKDPCADLTSTSCYTNAAFDPKQYDAFKNANNPTIVAGTAYTGAPGSAYVFDPTKAPATGAMTVDPMMLVVTGSTGSRTLKLTKSDGTTAVSSPTVCSYTLRRNRASVMSLVGTENTSCIGSTTITLTLTGGQSGDYYMLEVKAGSSTAQQLVMRNFPY